MRRTFAKLALKGRAPVEQIQISLVHPSIQTIERYLGVTQDFEPGKNEGVSVAEKMFGVAAPRGFKRFVIVALVVLTAATGFSSTIAYDAAVKITGSQAYFGSLGMDFQELEPIEVTEIGVFSNNAFGHFDCGASDKLKRRHFLDCLLPGHLRHDHCADRSIFSGRHNLFLVTDDWLSQNITPFELLPGFYTIVAQGYNALEIPEGRN